MNNEIRILIIEDDPMVREVNKQFVERVEGFRVVGMAGNGVAGISLLKKLNPHLILMDIYMPQKDGLETLRLIRKEQYDVDIIGITAASDASIIKQMLQQGVMDYIIKPFQFERVKRSLENYRTLRKKLQKDDCLSQSDLDHVLRISEQRKLKDEQSEHMPKGLHKATLQQIMLTLVNEQKPLSAEEVAELSGLARVTARRYLEYLAQTGQVRLEIDYHGIGRPTNRYCYVRPD
ncbi:MAG TPA: response regulator [Bacilli bacterium]